MRGRRLEECVVALFPRVAEGGEYVQRLSDLWSSEGATVVDYDSFPQHRPGRRATRAVVLNWFEDWMLANDRPAWLKLSWALATALYFRALCGRFVWVRHNFQAHDARANGWARRLLCLSLQVLADTVVTHRPVNQFPTTVVPHTMLGRVPFVDGARDIDFLWIGTIKRYKGLERLLGEWPVALRLRIVGYTADAALRAEIEGVIAARHLQVEWDNRFVDEAELNAQLHRARSVIVSNLDGAMIVSGSFFHAASLGASMLVRDSEFARELSRLYSFVTVYADGGIAESIRTQHPVPPSQVRQEMLKYHGDDVVSGAWVRALERPRGASMSKIEMV